MAKSSRPAKTVKNKSAVRNSRTTVSGPAQPDASGAGDIVAEKAAGTQDLASAFLFNPNKAAEYDPDAALAPPEGASVTPADPIVCVSIQLTAPSRPTRAFPSRTALPNGHPDPGVITARDASTASEAFISAIAKHRHFARETDPPRV